MLHALLVELHPDLQDLVHLYLTERGFTVTRLPNLLTCVEQMRRSPTPLLVVIDSFHLPVRPLSTAAAIAMLPRLIPLLRRHVSIILVDGRGLIAAYLQKRYPDLPMTVLRKPFTGEQLMAALSDAIDRLRPPAYEGGSTASER
jgi:CheY-like chemotaxis protein